MARLICFPFAGGSSITYRRWHLQFSDLVDVCAVELPGRGRRAKEAAYTNMEALVGDLTDAIQDLDQMPLFFFGHSLGALIAFCCARSLRERQAPLPQHVFMSGRGAPQGGNPDRTVTAMSDQEFLNMLRARGGTPKEILAEPELMARLIPMIRADFQLLNSFNYVAAPPFEFPMTILGGSRDPGIKEADLWEWRRHTTAETTVQIFPGDHFFLNSERSGVPALVGQTLRTAMGLLNRQAPSLVMDYRPI